MSRAADGDDARELLRLCLKMQERTNQISMHVVTKMTFNTADGQPRDQRVEHNFRRDGDLLDIAGSRSFEDKTGRTLVRYHIVVNPEYSLEWHESSGREPTVARNTLGPVSAADSPSRLFRTKTTDPAMGSHSTVLRRRIGSVSRSTCSPPRTSAFRGNKRSAACRVRS